MIITNEDLILAHVIGSLIPHLPNRLTLIGPNKPGFAFQSKEWVTHLLTGQRATHHTHCESIWLTKPYLLYVNLTHKSVFIFEQAKDSKNESNRLSFIDECAALLVPLYMTLSVVMHTWMSSGYDVITTPITWVIRTYQITGDCLH